MIISSRCQTPNSPRLIKPIWIIKCIGAAVTAFVLLNLFCFFYRGLPARINSSTGATDFIWYPNSVFSSRDEGGSIGRIDGNGFNNSYFASAPKTDILIMGSSNMQAFEVMPDQNACYLLNELLEQNFVDLSAYNIGMDGHDFLSCANCLADAALVYNPKYIIMETQSVSFSVDAMKQVAQNTYPHQIVSESTFVICLQKIPYLRLLGSQLYESGIAQQLLPGADLATLNKASEVNRTNDDTEYIQALYSLMSYLRQSAESSKILIVYHPHIAIGKDGAPSAETDANDLLAFKNACNSNDIVWIDLTEDYIKKYESEYLLPHGFNNSKAGEGHLNRYGHQMMAEKLFAAILELEAGK